MRDLLRLLDFLRKKKKDWSRGVQQNTRSQVQIDKVEKKIQICTIKYRAAHSALGALAQILEKGDSWQMEFKQLDNDHIKGLPSEGWGEGTRTLSWIWMTPGVVNPDSELNRPQLIDGGFCVVPICGDVNLPFLDSIASSMVSHSCSCYEMV